MLMADFVPQGAVGIEKLSKGTRLLNITRDVFFDGASPTLELNSAYSEGFIIYNNTNGYLQKLPFFGSGVINRFESNNSSSAGSVLAFTNDGTNFSGGTFFGDASSNQLAQNTGTALGHFGGIHSLDIGTYTSKLANTTATYFRANGYEVISPIHTSHHYKTFETPYLHELIGGDRNMEQTHLICSADGKTWDEVTRDTSYMGPSTQLIVASDGGNWNNSSGLTDHRGYFSRYGLGNKNIAWGYDRAIILEDGVYEIHLTAAATGGTNADLRIQRNNTTASASSNGTQYFSIAQDRVSVSSVVSWDLIKGDYIYLNEAGSGTIYGGNQETGAKLIITKVN